MDIREQRGVEIAKSLQIRRVHSKWLVPSTHGRKTYTVDLGGRVPTCTCPDYELQGDRCKHIYAVEHFLQCDMHRIPNPPSPRRQTYRQDWPAYNAAQVNEKARFLALLHDLCQTIPEPTYTFGRPRLPLRDMIFASAFKVYSTVSTRRFMTDLTDAHAKGYISRVPHFNSICNYLELPELYPLLVDLIERTSLVLKSVETNFAVDSSGFSTCQYTRWYNAKYEREQDVHEWLKVHLMCGVTTNIVTSVQVTGRFTNDTKMFPTLVEATTRHFTVEDVTADKAYSTRKNLEWAVGLGATPYIPFKSNTSGDGRGSELWEQLFHYFCLCREEFLVHYHRRSNVESTVAMIKAKFGAAIRSKGEDAQSTSCCARCCATTFVA